MEKVCEFCMALRPAVYCQADSALLCLSCDARVHSANALSNRHLRSLLCDSCRSRPASIRCEDHRMYMCRACDRSLHSSSGPGSQQQHQKHVINSYIGCPSAKDFAALWDLDLNEQRDVSISTPSQEFVDFRNSYKQHTGGSSARSVTSCTTSVNIGMPNGGTNNQQSNKRSHKRQQQQQNQSSRFILQQIFDLKRIQLNEGSRYSPIIRGEDVKNMPSSSGKAMRRTDEGNSQRSRDLESEFLQDVAPLEELRSEGFSSPFSSLENTPSSAAGVYLLGDSSWQCRSPLQTSQFMSQNIQDLGVCEDLICRDDFNNIPDVDMTFQSFDELFGGYQDPTRGLLTHDNDLSCSSLDGEISLDKSENSQIVLAIKDASASSSVYLGHRISDMSPPKQVRRPLRSSYSALSFSISQETEGATDSADGLRIRKQKRTL